MRGFSNITKTIKTSYKSKKKEIMENTLYILGLLISFGLPIIGTLYVYYLNKRLKAKYGKIKISAHSHNMSLVNYELIIKRDHRFRAVTKTPLERKSSKPSDGIRPSSHERSKTITRKIRYFESPELCG